MVCPRCSGRVVTGLSWPLALPLATLGDGRDAGGSGTTCSSTRGGEHIVRVRMSLGSLGLAYHEVSFRAVRRYRVRMMR